MSLLGWATLVLAGATTISVGFTAWMASKTSQLAEANEKLLEQNERHHIIDVRPIILIESKFNYELMENRRSLLKPVHPSDWSAIFPGMQSNFVLMGFESALKNIGTGVAMNPTMLIRFENSAVKELETDFSPVAAGSSLPLEKIVFSARLDSAFLDQNRRFKPEEYQHLIGQSWDIFIRYYDIYGNVYYTRHPKDPNQRWTNLGERGEDIPPGKSKAEMEAEFAMLVSTSSDCREVR